MGYNPPPLAGRSKIAAGHYRTWQFLDPLLSDGHTICLCAKSDTTGASLAHSHWPAAQSTQLTHHAISFGDEVGWSNQLQTVHDAFGPACVVAVGFDIARYATQLRTHQPLWIDISGDPLTIVQADGYQAASDRELAATIAMMRGVLKKGDVFSVCSLPQQHVLVGELAMAVRLNWRTFGYQFVRVVLPSAWPSTRSDVQRSAGRQQVPADGFVALWCGGYHTWTDVDTLFKAVEYAMAKSPTLHYVSVGANAYEAPDNTYARLLRLIESSVYRTRFHMLGWQPWHQVSGYYQQSDVGLSVDAFHYETIYGTRTRLVEMMTAGLPVITSLGCELADLVRKAGAGLTFETGDWQAFGEHLIRLTNDNHLRDAMAQRALQYARHDLSFAITAQPLRDWVNAPSLAPDKGPRDH
jgi:glycosyltransferase involved in cell wall biosynthesis